ncbi:hypothetical protein HAX54_012597 [Datura stramonium]|uniref:Uncharacterized protein n=1 Tax=Datura stramonium TaxID=4076 RepID=A0ABS8TLT6_DATST|nr:hypothetical protein [Datura stramonium]
MSSSSFNSTSITPVTRKIIKEGEGKEALSESSTDEILSSTYFFDDDFKFLTHGGTGMNRRLVIELVSLVKGRDAKGETMGLNKSIDYVINASCDSSWLTLGQLGLGAWRAICVEGPRGHLHIFVDVVTAPRPEVDSIFSRRGKNLIIEEIGKSTPTIIILDENSEESGVSCGFKLCKFQVLPAPRQRGYFSKWRIPNKTILKDYRQVKASCGAHKPLCHSGPSSPFGAGPDARMDNVPTECLLNNYAHTAAKSGRDDEGVTSTLEEEFSIVEVLEDRFNDDSDG